MEKLLDELKDTLKQDDRLFADDKLLKNKAVERALDNDEKLLELLASNERLKEHFFTEAGEHLVFDEEKFAQFVSNKQFLPDSYTAFKNKVGLKQGNEHLQEKEEIELAWPYKDCVLEGGQTKEDQNGRTEKFWNKTLAPDQVDTLLDPKVLSDFKRISKNGESELEELDNENLILKGNNLLGLHSLLKKYREEVDMIYIDPPYNTGNDDFSYNDNFNQSTWLTFMKNRLEAAKDLLKEEGAIFISIDQNEIGYLTTLMDEIFGEENRRNIVTIKRSAVSGPKVINPGLVNISEYLLIYSKSDKWEDNTVYTETDIDRRYNNFIKNKEDHYKDWEICTVLDALSEEKVVDKRNLKDKLGTKFEEELRDFVIRNADKVIQFANLDEDSVSKDAAELKKKSNENPDEIYHLEREDGRDYYIKKGKVMLFYEDRLVNLGGELVPGRPASDIWTDVMPNDLHNEGGVKLRKGKKPEKLLHRILKMGSEEGDLVLDFFLGSGTTAAVAHKTGRQYIGIEQIDYGENSAIERLKNVINGDDDRGISDAVDWDSGGDFVYAELMQWNAEFIERIDAAEDSEELQDVWSDMKDQAFLSYRIDVDEFEENAEEFEDLELEKQKEFLKEILDNNQLYVNYSEIEDSDYEIDEETIELNKQFYNGE